MVPLRGVGSAWPVTGRDLLASHYRSALTATQEAASPRPAAKLTELESLRGFAACYVVVGHICNVYFHSPSWSFPLRFAGEAVILFFLLSGFVIRYSTKDSTSIGAYLFKRLRRIYPLFVLSLILSWGTASVVLGRPAPVALSTLVGNLVMLQDFGFMRPGVWVHQFYNQALWSLSYEFWFYALFIVSIRLFGPAKHRDRAVAALALVGFGLHLIWPNQFSYFATHLSIWWAGVRIAHEFRTEGRVTLRRQAPWSGFLLAVGGLWAIPLFAMPRDAWSLGLYPIMEIRRFIFSAVFVVAAITVANHLWSRGGRWLFHRSIGPFKYIAPISYGVYVFHFPIVDALARFEVFSNPIVYLMTCISLIVIVSFVCEIWIQNWINRRTNRMLKRLEGGLTPAIARPSDTAPFLVQVNVERVPPEELSPAEHARPLEDPIPANTNRD